MLTTLKVELNRPSKADFKRYEGNKCIATLSSPVGANKTVTAVITSQGLITSRERYSRSKVQSLFINYKI